MSAMATSSSSAKLQRRTSNRSSILQEQGIWGKLCQLYTTCTSQGFYHSQWCTMMRDAMTLMSGLQLHVLAEQCTFSKSGKHHTCCLPKLLAATGPPQHQEHCLISLPPSMCCCSSKGCSWLQLSACSNTTCTANQTGTNP